MIFVSSIFTTLDAFNNILKRSTLHTLATNAYNDLVEILQNPAFNTNDVVKNVRRFRQWRRRLPLIPIKAQTVKIDRKKTPSTSKGTKNSYYLSIADIIWNVLNNPVLYDTLYFGPGIEVETKKEFWHGDLWAESPLFGQDKIIIKRGMIENIIRLFIILSVPMIITYDI